MVSLSWCNTGSFVNTRLRFRFSFPTPERLGLTANYKLLAGDNLICYGSLTEMAPGQLDDGQSSTMMKLPRSEAIEDFQFNTATPRRTIWVARCDKAIKAALRFHMPLR